MSTNRQNSQDNQNNSESRGILMAAGAYLAWVIFPIYFRSLQQVPPLEILSHRVVWSLLFLAGLLTWQQRWGWLARARKSRSVLLTYAAAAAFLGANWYIYIWAVNNGHILDGSLGYFINPLVSVLLGIVFFRERLRVGQFVAIAIAALGVAYMTIMYGQLPWISLSLACTFAVYGLIKKKAPLPAAQGLTLETAFLFPLALIYLLFLEAQGVGTFGHAGLSTNVLLALSGVITAVPLMLFASAAQLIPLSVLGVMQYIAPTGQFIVAVYVYGEDFPPYKLVGFCIVWLALVIFSVEGYVARRRALRLATTPA